MKSYLEEIEKYQDDYDIEYEMKLSNFLDGGGENLGYTREEYPDFADFEDVLINEITIEKYKQLTDYTIIE